MWGMFWNVQEIESCWDEFLIFYKLYLVNQVLSYITLDVTHTKLDVKDSWYDKVFTIKLRNFPYHSFNIIGHN